LEPGLVSGNHIAPHYPEFLAVCGEDDLPIHEDVWRTVAEWTNIHWASSEAFREGNKKLPPITLGKSELGGHVVVFALVQAVHDDLQSRRFNRRLVLVEAVKRWYIDTAEGMSSRRGLQAQVANGGSNELV